MYSLFWVIIATQFKSFFSLSGDFQDGKRVSLSVYLGEFFDIHVFVNGTVLQGDQRQVRAQKCQIRRGPDNSPVLPHRLSDEAAGPRERK